jgi:hypothetical protein
MILTWLYTLLKNILRADRHFAADDDTTVTVLIDKSMREYASRRLAKKWPAKVFCIHHKARKPIEMVIVILLDRNDVRHVRSSYNGMVYGVHVALPLKE